MNWYKISQEETPMSMEELRQHEFEGHEWGHSITPKRALDKRDDEDEFETLHSIAEHNDTWRLNNVLGKGWEGHWDGVSSSVHLIPLIKANQPIPVFRSSDIGPILPGSYVSESRAYAQNHGDANIPDSFEVYSIKVYPDQLMTYDDPHEFIYIPRNLNIAYERYIGPQTS